MLVKNNVCVKILLHARKAAPVRCKCRTFVKDGAISVLMVRSQK